MNLSNDKLAIIRDSIVSCATDLLSEATPHKVGVIRLIAGIITQAIHDLSSKSNELVGNAADYFVSDEYSKHCEMLGITEDLMDKIVSRAGSCTPVRYDELIDDE